MNVAVLAAPDKSQELLGILEILKSLSIRAFGLKIGKEWGKVARQGLAARIESASHILVLSAPAIIDEPWFLFASGYALGKSARMVLYRLDPDWQPPAFLSRLPLIDTDVELTDFYRLEKAEWELEEGRRVAKSALLEIGISFHSESLAQCVAEGDIHAVELFLKAGFHPNSRDKQGVPLLCLAARHKHRGVADLLISWGASIDAQSEDRGYSPLMDAVLAGAGELAELFLAEGADTDLQSKDGQTALVIAVGRGDIDLARLLVEHGADPDIADKLGLSARGYASLFKKPELLGLFPPKAPGR